MHVIHKSDCSEKQSNRVGGYDYHIEIYFGRVWEPHLNLITKCIAYGEQDRHCKDLKYISHNRKVGLGLENQTNIKKTKSSMQFNANNTGGFLVNDFLG